MVKQELEGRIMSIQLKLSGILQVIFYNFIMSCLRIPTKPLRNLLKDSQVVTGKKKKKIDDMPSPTVPQFIIFFKLFLLS